MGGKMKEMSKFLTSLALLALLACSGYSQQEEEVFPLPEDEQTQQEGTGQFTGPAPVEARPETQPGAIQPEPATPVVQPKPVKKKKPEKLPPGLAKITVRLSNVSLSTFLNAVSQQTKVNFILSEGLEKKTITAFLDQVTLEEALQVLLGIKGLTYEKIPGKTDTYLVTTRKETQPRTITRIFELKYIPLQNVQMDLSSSGADEESSSSVELVPVPGETGGEGGQGGAQTATEASGIVNILKTVLSSFGRIAVDSRTNSLIITDLPERFAQVESLIRDLDKKSPQVIIEAQIVEINSNGLQRLGVEFGGPNGELMRFVGPSRYTDYLMREGGFTGAETRQFFHRGNLNDQGISAGAFTAPGGVSVSVADPRSGVTFGVLSFNEFQILLRAIVTKTRGKILSKPKIMTVNNKSAEIRITANQAIGTAATVLSGGSGTTSIERQITGLILRVTPQVNGDGYITMVVEPKLIRVIPSVIASGTVLDPVTRSVKSMVRVKNGDTIVVGGLIDTREERTVRQVPFLGSIPILGWLFTSQRTEKVSSELAIFMTPTIMEN